MNTHNLQGGGALARRAARPPRVERVRVLVVMHPDGYLEVFGDRERVLVHFAELLDVRPEHEQRAEYLAWLRLPHPYRDLWFANKCIGTALLRPRTVEQEAWRLHNLELLGAMRDAGAILRGNGKAVPA